MQLRRGPRKVILTIHVLVSLGWLGVTLCLLALGITGAVRGSPAAAEAAYRSMKVFGDWLLIPLSLLTLITGVVLSLRTPWGLARHRWVLTKFWLTLVTVAASAFALRANIDAAAGDVAAGRAARHPIDLVVPPSVALATYVFMTVISVFKPWGLTARGRRLREQAGLAARAGRAAAPAQRV